MEPVKKNLETRIEERYGKMIDYYAAVLSRCHQAVKTNNGLNKLDPMGQKTSATTLFIRTTSRMDESDKKKSLKAEDMIAISKDVERAVSVNK